MEKQKNMTESTEELRSTLIKTSMEWERTFGVSPHITSAVSELDAALLIGCSSEQYAECMKNRTAVSQGYDFVFNEKRYQVKANRPSGKKGSKVTIVPMARNYDWDYLIWILYDMNYVIQEAWLWEAEEYKKHFSNSKRISPEDMRVGKTLIK